MAVYFYFPVKYLNKDTNLVLLRCSRDMHNIVLSALPFVKTLGNAEMFINTIHVAGKVIGMLYWSTIDTNRPDIDHL